MCVLGILPSSILGNTLIIIHFLGEEGNMKKDIIKRTISEALIYRGFSVAEAEQLIRRVATPDKAVSNNKPILHKTIDVYA